MNADELDGLEETIEILNDKRAVASIKKSMKEIKQGKLIPLEEVIKELNEIEKLKAKRNL